MRSPKGLTQQFGSLLNTDWSTDQWAQVGTLPNGSESFALTDPSYDAAGDALTLFSTNTVSGSTGSTSTGAVPNAYPYSPDGTHDVFTTILHLTLPANQPAARTAATRAARLHGHRQLAEPGRSPV